MNLHETYFHEDSGNASRDASLGAEAPLRRLETAKPAGSAFFVQGESGMIKASFFGELIGPEWRYYIVGFKADHAMSVKLDPHNRLKGSANLLLALAVAVVMTLLFLRMVVFVVGHGHPS